MGSDWPVKWTVRRLLHFRVLSGLVVRTKPQAPRPLRCWLTSSFVAGIGCESQEVTHCDSSSQNDARRARASQLLCRHDAALSAFRRAVRTTLPQVAGQARSGPSAQLPGLSARSEERRVGKE